ncbi:hypothetical protein BDB01DRAFT_772246 [Pilobolus umbonatus]|nr:hypothetical protein BDB01DRAFT_772246 [Pilobolus umbonatus]
MESYNGVRAEPKFLRDPTSFESISSGISRLSSYVTSNLPKRKQSMISPLDPQYQHFMSNNMNNSSSSSINDAIDNEEEIDDCDTITFSSFERIESRDTRLSCLLIGYLDGFQIWDITSPDNVHEICSLRDKDTYGTVTFLHILNTVHKDNDEQDEFREQRPLLMIISDNTVDSNEDNISHKHIRNESISSKASSIKKSSIIRLYSLKSQSIVKEIHDFGNEEDDNTAITCIKSNHRVIAMGCLSRHRSSIHILSLVDLKPLTNPLMDVYHDPSQGPVFTLGSRFIAYATSTPIINSDPVMSLLTNKSIGYTGFGVLQGEKDVKGAAKDIAKEVVSGMKTLSEMGYNTLSSYFSPGNPNDKMMYGSSPTRRKSMGTSPGTKQDYITTLNSSSSSSTKKITPSGMIMIRDILKLPSIPTRNISASIIAHFKPHTHPISCLRFNQAGTILMSASKPGHTFHIFTILTSGTPNTASHLYSLSRGFTDAQIEDCQFSIDSTWCAVSTARGTTHIYAINPYGGKPEIAGHVHGKVNNPLYHPLKTKLQTKAITLGSVVRIKQRRKMPGNNNSINSSQDDLGKYAGGIYTNIGTPHGYYGPTPPNYTSSLPILVNRSYKEPRAKLTCMFLSASQSPYLVNNSVYKTSKFIQPPHTASSMNTKGVQMTSSNSLNSIKQQASSMLSSFGSSMSNIPYLPQQPRSHQWNINDKVNDTLMFGFDEEYDDAAKMMNDEVGYQDVYSFHPGGILTLHRCWVGKTVVKKRENGRNFEKLDLSLKEEDVAEWKVARSSDWEEVRIPIDISTTIKKTKRKSMKARAGNKLWLSNAEITPYSVSDESALWFHDQFSFQTYKDKNLKQTLLSGHIPATETLVLLKGMPEPVSSRIDRVRKTTTRIANDSLEENMDDALAELEDNLSNAMQTSFSPSNSINASPAGLKWLSSSANTATHDGSLSSMTNLVSNRLDRHSSVSFEDAYLINMGSGPSPEPSMHGFATVPVNYMQNSSLIQFEDEDEGKAKESFDEDVIRLEQSDEERLDYEEKIEYEQQEIYSPDGDNEVAHPYDSIFGDTTKEDTHVEKLLENPSQHW